MMVNPYLLSEFERKREHTIDELQPKETCAPQGMPRYPTFSRQREPTIIKENPALDLSVRVSLFASGKTEGDISASLSFGGTLGSWTASI